EDVLTRNTVRQTRTTRYFQLDMSISRHDQGVKQMFGDASQVDTGRRPTQTTTSSVIAKD
ncbi:MAG: hypothetical protein NWR61_03170, partial [Pseudomonadales bacterium]|nr:hypothetical protein [Pseudomonadales bacterium]MDP4875320.1 hypothetical protein [Pseudomonadales bacterium]